MQVGFIEMSRSGLSASKVKSFGRGSRVGLRLRVRSSRYRSEQYHKVGGGQ